MKDSSPVVLPGATIGMVGGGQLGRMFAQAAAAMGYQVVVLCESADMPAAQVAHRVVVGELDEKQAVETFAASCDVITLEFENIPADTIAQCAGHAPTYPAASVLATAQNRLLEKGTLKAAGLPVTPYQEVDSAESLAQAAKQHGWPMIVKTAQSGYDGKGQYRVASRSEAEQVPWKTSQSWIAEKLIDFVCEVSVVVARTPDGRCESFPVFENAHRNHILDLSTVPANVSEVTAEEARRVAIRAAESLGVVGLLCVEFFLTDDGVLINEVAPRPHNSGHLTIEGCLTSQFEQHVRAVCNLPLGSTELRRPAAAMANLLGDLWKARNSTPPWDQALQDPAVSLHLYGKRKAKVGRKMGHLTVVGDERDDVAKRALEARGRLLQE